MKLLSECLHSCAGCEVSLVDNGPDMLEFMRQLEVVHMPLLVDGKYFGQEGTGKEMVIPRADVAIVSGGVANRDHLGILKKVRQRCDCLVALGTCATHGGIPALINQWPVSEAMRAVFSRFSNGRELKFVQIPEMLDRVYALDEKVRVDLMLPGCPPRSSEILHVLKGLVGRQDPGLPSKSVCDSCPVAREGKGGVKKLRRFLDNSVLDVNRPLEEMRCFLEQGFLCMGPVTAAGCAGRGAPLCIRAGVPCRGCFGPARPGGNQLLDMINALASNGIDWKSIVDRPSLLRFSGAHGLLRPARKRQ